VNNLLKNPNVSVTVFAPDNNAFVEAGIDNTTELGALAAILLNHIVLGRNPAGSANTQCHSISSNGRPAVSLLRSTKEEHRDHFVLARFVARRVGAHERVVAADGT
jgi:uncharacterized surface protein with fasciclin (FAS1) repeats